jgi:hypothetical protein
VNYRSRVGVSSVTGDLWKAWKLGLRMIALVLDYRFSGFSARRIVWDRTEKDPRTTSLHTLNQAISNNSDPETDQPLEPAAQGKKSL